MSSRHGYQVAAIALAIVAGVGVHVVWYLFVNTATGQAIDRAAFEGALVQQPHLWQIGRPVLEVVSNTLVAGSAIAAVVIALLRRRAWLAIQALIVIVGANVTTQLVKSWYDRPYLLSGWTGQNSLPSGHTTVVAAASIAVLLTVPRRWRWVVALLGTVWTLLTGVSTLIGRWHRPADVVAALFVACFWGAIACLFGSGRSLDFPAAHGKYRPIIITAALLTGLGAISAAAAAWFLARLYGILAASDASLSFTDRLAGSELTAYVGGIGAVMGSIFGVFAALLWLRDRTLSAGTRMPPAQNLAAGGYGAGLAGAIGVTNGTANVTAHSVLSAAATASASVNQEEMWLGNW